MLDNTKCSLCECHTNDMYILHFIGIDKEVGNNYAVTMCDSYQSRSRHIGHLSFLFETMFMSNGNIVSVVVNKFHAGVFEQNFVYGDKAAGYNFIDGVINNA